MLPQPCWNEYWKQEKGFEFTLSPGVCRLGDKRLSPGKAQATELLLFLLLSDFPTYLVLRGSLQGCSVPLFPLNQGQLELLRRLFTEALYEETLSQVSLGRWVQEAFLLDAPGLELK